MNASTSIAHDEWVALKNRTIRRLARVADVIQILFFDAVVILFWQVILVLIKRFSTPGSGFFNAVRIISDGACALAYLVWVTFDLVEFFEQSYLRRGRDVNTSA